MRISVAVSVGALTLRGTELQNLMVRQQLGGHCFCTIDFHRDASRRVALRDLLGARTKITLESDAHGTQTVFTGLVVDGAQSPSADGGSGFTLTAYSNSVRLDYHSTAYYRQATLQKIAGDLHIKLVGSGAGGGPLDYVQYGESDLEFVNRIAEEHGLFLRTSGDGPELHDRFADRGWTLQWNATLQGLKVGARLVNAGYKGAVYVAGEKRDHQFHQVRKTPSWLGGASAIVDRVSELADGFAGGGDPHAEGFAARSTTLEDFRTQLERGSERALGSAVRVEGTSIHPGLAAGDLCTIADGEVSVLPEGLGGAVGLVSVTHLWDHDGYHNQFVATPWANFTASRRTPRRLVSGPISAEVVENEDPERMGRLRVRFYWQEKSGTPSTRWIRLATPYAGKDRGWFALPEIGDEVLVAFEQGDPERPVVIGALWNGKDQAPEAPPGNVAKRFITRSGNTVLLLDEAGKETIELFTAKGTCLVQLANSADKPLITLRSGGDISLEAEGEIRMKCKDLTQRVAANAYQKAGANATVEAGQNLTSRAGTALTVEGMNTTVKASGNLIALAGAVNSIGGSVVHLQPPGLSAPAASISAPAEKPTVWAARPTPARATPFKTGSDTKARRSEGP